MGFTLQLTPNYPIRMMYWMATIRNGVTTSGWLGPTEVWQYDSDVEGVNDLYVRIIDGEWDTLHEESGMGPLQNGRRYEFRLETDFWGNVTFSDIVDLGLIDGDDDWIPLWEVEVTLVPSEEQVGEWFRLWEVEVILTPEGMIPCTPGQTKCIGPDLYTCNAMEKWELTEKDSSLCPVDEFPWKWVLIGGGAIAATAAAVALTRKPKRKK